jgi:hypothetical protein
VQSSNLNANRSLRQSSFAPLWALMIGIGLGIIAWPDQAQGWTGQPLAYVTSTDGISVIDTGDNKIVDTIRFCSTAAVAPDGKHVYAFGPNTSDFEFNIFVIDATNDKVVAKIPLDVTDVSGGKSLNEYLYATTGLCSSGSFDCSRPDAIYYALWGIDTATNKVVAASLGKGISDGIAFTPDGLHTYFTNFDPGFSFTPLVLADTGEIILSENGSDYAIAVTPDGKRAYVPYVFFNGTNFPPENVAVIDTATNTLEHTITIEPSSFDTATKTVEATIAVAGPGAIAIVAPPHAVPFLSFDARLNIHLADRPNHDAFNLWSSFMLSGATNDGIHPDTEPVKLQIGPFTTTIPAGSFKPHQDGRSYTFAGVIDDVHLEVRIETRGGFSYAIHAKAKGANFSGTTNPVQVLLGIGDDAGLTSVTAHFDRDNEARNDWTDHWR